MIRLETERLVIRPYEEKDLADLHKLLSDKKNMYFLDDITTNTLEETHENLKEATKLNQSGKARRLAVTLKEDNRFVGGIGYDTTAETPVGKVVHLGYFILPEFQGQGYTTEAARKVLNFAFMQDNCVRVTTGCYSDNIPTQKVMQKVGFRKEAEKIKSKWHDGQMKDRLEFAINRDEYKIINQ